MERRRAPKKPTSGVILLLVACVLLAATAPGTRGAGYWSSPELIGENDQVDSIMPAVGFASDGTAVVVWMTWDSTELDTEILYVAVRDSLQSEPALVHEPNATMDRIPRMSVGEDGVPWLIWERYGDGYEQVVSHWTGVDWSPPETVFTQGERYDQFNIYAGDSEDVWAMKSSRANVRVDKDIFLRRWDGNGWGDVEVVGFDRKDDMSPVMLRDRDGVRWLSWMCDDTEWNVCAASRDSVGWSTPAKIDTLPGNIWVTDGAVCPDGRPLIVWSGEGFQLAGDVEYAVLNPSGWEYGGLVNEPDDPRDDGDGGTKLSPGDGEELWATWLSYRRDSYPEAWVVAARWLGHAWSEEELVSIADTAAPFGDGGVDVAVSGEGVAWCVWDRYDTLYPHDRDIYMSRREAPSQQGGEPKISLGASPNPAKDSVSVSVLGVPPSGATLAIYNAAGQLVRRLPIPRRRATAGGGPLTLRWDLRSAAGVKIASGVYYVALEAGMPACIYGKTEVTVVR